MHFLTVHKYLWLVNNKVHRFKKKSSVIFYIQQAEKEISSPEPMCGSECLGTVCQGTTWDQGLCPYSYSHPIIHLYMYACKSMTSCTFNTFPINSGSWSLHQVKNSHQRGDSRNLEQMSMLSWEFLKSYTIISIFYISILKELEIVSLHNKPQIYSWFSAS